MSSGDQSAEHWNNVYKKTEPTKLAWYQDIAAPSLDLIKKCSLKPSDLILDIGSGQSILIDNLLSMGFSSIIASDISEKALNISKSRLGKTQSAKVRWVVDDVLDSSSLNQLRNVSLWHDRAVFHFFTQETEREQYHLLLDTLVRQGGYVILATFNLEGAKKCSGLEVKRYDIDMLNSFLGKSYQLIHWFNYHYTMPSGAHRPYIYSLYHKL